VTLGFKFQLSSTEGTYVSLIVLCVLRVSGTYYLPKRGLQTVLSNPSSFKLQYLHYLLFSLSSDSICSSFTAYGSLKPQRLQEWKSCSVREDRHCWLDIRFSHTGADFFLFAVNKDLESAANFRFGPVLLHLAEFRKMCVSFELRRCLPDLVCIINSPWQRTK